jgi:glutamate-1-semialdehyde aminotransferase
LQRQLASAEGSITENKAVLNVLKADGQKISENGISLAVAAANEAQNANIADSLQQVTIVLKNTQNLKKIEKSDTLAKKAKVMWNELRNENKIWKIYIKPEECKRYSWSAEEEQNEVDRTSIQSIHTWNAIYQTYF